MWKFLCLVTIFISIVVYQFVYAYAYGSENFSSDTKSDEKLIQATASATINHAGEIDYIEITHPGADYSTPPTIGFNGQCTRTAKALAVIDTGRVVGILILDSGTGYTLPPEVIISGGTQDRNPSADMLNSIVQQIAQLLSKNNSDSGAVNGQAMTMAMDISSSPVSSSLTPDQVQAKATQYDAIIKEINTNNAAKQAQAKAKLVDIVKYQEKESTATIYAKKYGLAPPPKMYTDAEVTQAKADAKATIPKVLSTSQKAQCMMLLDDYNQKNEKSQDLGNLSQSQPYLIPSVKKASDLAQTAQQLYMNTCVN
jgi:hypothetical protein